MKNGSYLILVSNMIDRDVVFSLKHLDGSGPFFSLTKLHANYLFDLFFSVSFYLNESIGYEFCFILI